MKRFFNLRSLALAAAMVLALVTTLVHPAAVHAEALAVTYSNCFPLADGRGISYQFCQYAPGSIDPNNVFNLITGVSFTGDYFFLDTNNTWQVAGQYTYNQANGVVDAYRNSGNTNIIGDVTGTHYELIPAGNNQYTIWEEIITGQYRQVISLFD